MSDADSFIDEVTEEVRRDKLFALMRRYGWIGILAVILIVGGAAFNEWRNAQARTAARALGDALVAAMDMPTPGERATAVAAVQVSGPEQAALRGFLLAAAQADAGDSASAVATLAAIATDPALPEGYRQLANLKRVIAAGSDMAPAERAATLDLLAAPGAPYRSLAMEQQALDLVLAGNAAGAVAKLQELLQEAGISAGLRRRATQLIVALGAEPEPA